jgi:hypothetical protein
MKSTDGKNNGGSLKAEAGLWVDHREALIVVLSETGEETKRIQSNVQKQLRRTGEPSTGRFEYQEVPADDSRQRAYTGYLARYYDEIVAYLRNAGAVLIFGPGEAKGELKKRFRNGENRRSHRHDGNDRQNDRAANCGSHPPSL